MGRVYHSDIELLHEVGQGSFGTVYKAVYNGGKVAIKIVRTKGEAYAESHRFAGLSHKNIVSLLGMVFPDGSSHSTIPWLMMEYVTGGSLLHNLVNGKIRKNRNHRLTLMAHGVACGMEYLHGHGSGRKFVVHRDLAARNVLVVSLGTSEVKICDFGLSGSYEETDHYGTLDYEGTGSPLPIRWMPSENFYGNPFSRKGDVWAFGVLLCEMWSDGELPYGNMGHSSVKRYVESGGNPLDYANLHGDCPQDIIDTMNACFAVSKADRPNFRNIRIWIEDDNPDIFI